MEKLAIHLARAYVKYSEKNLTEIRELLDNDTWYYGKEIEDNNFVNNVIDDGSDDDSDKDELIMLTELAIKKEGVNSPSSYSK